MAWACAMMKLYKRGLFEGLRFPVGKNVEDNFLMYKLFLKANRVVHTEKCIYWYRVGRSDTLSQVWTEKRVLSMRWKPSKKNWLFLGCWAMI